MIAAYQKRCQSRVDTALEALFQAPRSELERLYQAMRYSVLNGGNSAPGRDNRVGPKAWLELADAFWQASTDTSDGRP